MCRKLNDNLCREITAERVGEGVNIMLSVCKNNGQMAKWIAVKDTGDLKKKVNSVSISHGTIDI